MSVRDIALPRAARPSRAQVSASDCSPAIQSARASSALRRLCSEAALSRARMSLSKRVASSNAPASKADTARCRSPAVSPPSLTERVSRRRMVRYCWRSRPPRPSDQDRGGCLVWPTGHVPDLDRCAPTGAMQAETDMTMRLAVETARPSPRAHLCGPASRPFGSTAAPPPARPARSRFAWATA